MNLFWQSRKPGITEREYAGKFLGKQNLSSRFRSILGANKFFGSELGRRKAAAVDAALGVGLDADRNTPHDQHVIQRDEFDTAIKALERGKVITAREAAELTKAAEKDLKNC